MSSGAELERMDRINKCFDRTWDDAPIRLPSFADIKNGVEIKYEPIGASDDFAGLYCDRLLDSNCYFPAMYAMCDERLEKALSLLVDALHGMNLLVGILWRRKPTEDNRAVRFTVVTWFEEERLSRLQDKTDFPKPESQK